VRSTPLRCERSRHGGGCVTQHKRNWTLADERDTSLRNARLAAATLEAPQTKHHNLAEKMLLRFLS
jgi:hypothetical protein